MEKQPLPERKNIRWDKQDYSHPGEYMITVCTKDMKQILSKIVVDTERAHHDTPLRLSNSHGYNQTVGTGVPDVPFKGVPKNTPQNQGFAGNPVDVPHEKTHLTNGYAQTVGDDVLVVPRIELTYYGKIADKYINQLNDFYKNINVIKYVIMPNHIHLLLQIPDGTTGTSSPTGEQTDVTNGGKTSSSTIITDARPVEHSVIADFVSTFKRFCHKEIGEKIFQRSYHDHVIRDDNDFIGAVSYIENNPTRWTDKS